MADCKCFRAAVYLNSDSSLVCCTRVSADHTCMVHSRRPAGTERGGPPAGSGSSTHLEPLKMRPGSAAPPSPVAPARTAASAACRLQTIGILAHIRRDILAQRCSHSIYEGYEGTKPQCLNGGNLNMRGNAELGHLEAQVQDVGVGGEHGQLAALALRLVPDAQPLELGVLDVGDAVRVPQAATCV